jgi:hypothetical protein
MGQRDQTITRWCVVGLVPTLSSQPSSHHNANHCFTLHFELQQGQSLIANVMKDQGYRKYKRGKV